MTEKTEQKSLSFTRESDLMNAQRQAGICATRHVWRGIQNSSKIFLSRIFKLRPYATSTSHMNAGSSLGSSTWLTLAKWTSRQKIYRFLPVSICNSAFQIKKSSIEYLSVIMKKCSNIITMEHWLFRPYFVKMSKPRNTETLMIHFRI